MYISKCARLVLNTQGTKQGFLIITSHIWFLFADKTIISRKNTFHPTSVIKLSLFLRRKHDNVSIVISVLLLLFFTEENLRIIYPSTSLESRKGNMNWNGSTNVTRKDSGTSVRRQPTILILTFNFEEKIPLTKPPNVFRRKTQDETGPSPNSKLKRCDNPELKKLTFLRSSKT